MDRFSKMPYSIYDLPWKQHHKRKWLESVLRDLYKKLITTMEEINETDPAGFKKLKIGKERWRKMKFCSFPVRGRKKSRIKCSLVKVIYAEATCEKVEVIHAPENRLPKAAKFWEYVDECYEVSRKACNAKEAVHKGEIKSCLKLPRRKKKRVKKRKCFARTRPGFLTSIIMEDNFFYPMIVHKYGSIGRPKRKKVRWNLKKESKLKPKVQPEVQPEVQPVVQPKPNSKLKPRPEPQRRSARVSNVNTKTKCVENVKPESQQCEASKPKMKRRKGKNYVSLAKPKSQCKRKT